MILRTKNSQKLIFIPNRLFVTGNFNTRLHASKKVEVEESGIF
jgi:hypothetical protein